MKVKNILTLCRAHMTAGDSLSDVSRKTLELLTHYKDAGILGDTNDIDILKLREYDALLLKRGQHKEADKMIFAEGVKIKDINIDIIRHIIRLHNDIMEDIY